MSTLSVTKKTNQSQLPPLIIAPSPWWITVLWYGALHSLLIALLCLFFTFNVALCCVVFALCLSFIYLNRECFSKQHIHYLCLDKGDWFVCYKKDESHKTPVALQKGGFFSPLITVLPFKEITGKRTQVVFMPPWVDKEHFRQLRVRVGFQEGVG